MPTSLRTADTCNFPGKETQEIKEIMQAERLRDELERVGYVTSHDLQSPLRVILSCCDELANHPVLASDATVGETVKLLASEAARMKIMMQGLLEYVRLETFVTANSELDSNEIVAAALATLEEDIRVSGAVIQYEGLPKILGHRGRITRLFAFLLDNALKFHGSQPPVIRISARPVGNRWEFCVADNGIGIDEEHQDIIFALYQRLHTGEAYPGHGIGLALARKIVEAHGGMLRVESTPKQGSRFYFTLPMAKA